LPLSFVKEAMEDLYDEYGNSLIYASAGVGATLIIICE
jgi:hypothetical protein